MRASGVAFALVYVVPQTAARETHERPENFQSSAKKGFFDTTRQLLTLTSTANG